MEIMWKEPNNQTKICKQTKYIIQTNEKTMKGTWKPRRKAHIDDKTNKIPNHSLVITFITFSILPKPKRDL